MAMLTAAYAGREKEVNEGRNATGREDLWSRCPPPTGKGSNWSETSGNDLVVIGMRPDPDPMDSIWNIEAQRPIVVADSGRPQFSDTFQVKRGMPWIGFQKGKVLICQGADLFR
jgi:hypothetical protein